MSRIESRDCELRIAAQGVVEPCPGEQCSFWEPGGAVLDGGCLIERLGIDLRLDDLAVYLLETRERVESLRGGTT